jgi:hypothetical protein
VPNGHEAALAGDPLTGLAMAEDPPFAPTPDQEPELEPAPPLTGATGVVGAGLPTTLQYSDAGTGVTMTTTVEVTLASPPAGGCGHEPPVGFAGAGAGVSYGLVSVRVVGSAPQTVQTVTVTVQPSGTSVVVVLVSSPS